MTLSEDDSIRLQHMLDYARKALRFSNGKTRTNLEQDEQLMLALVRTVEVIGEAASKTSPYLQERTPSIPWADIIGTRNRLVHGASLTVNVSNAYRSSLFGKKHDFAISADRIATLKEREIECWIDQRLIMVRMKSDRKRGAIFCGFPWEISRKHLKNFPVMLEFDRRYKFLGLTILS